ncbi:hypothetical protein BH24ACI3_BH24ACI3_08400 [soil metagenome]
MFEKMIESESGTHAGDRGRYFLVSAIAVGALFVTAVAFSLYAADFDLGVGDLEISRMVAPEIVEPPKAEPAKETPQQTPTESPAPSRTDHIARVDEHQKTPATISVTPSTVPARPRGYYDISDRNFDPSNVPGGIAGPGIGRGNGNSTTGASGDAAPAVEVNTTPPPPVKAKALPPQSKGVINGLATSLPQPPYPLTARTMRISGNVSVQVTISETGKVISANAVSGHALLKNAAEKAAWNARFTPTTLTGQPVKVTGVIVYKFSIN